MSSEAPSSSALPATDSTSTSAAPSDAAARAPAPAPAPTRASSILAAFGDFRTTLDTYTDRRERLIKLSRDITAASKKLIFLLHRVSLSTAPADAEDPFKEARAKEAEILKLFVKVGAEFVQAEGVDPATAPDRFWRFENNVSGGLQEYIEAISFLHFLEHSGGLISLDEVQKRLSDAGGKPFFPVTASDYILGLSDLTGELMRFTLNAIGQGQQDRALESLSVVRNIKNQFDPLVHLLPYTLPKKQEETSRSLTKIEDAAYQVALRRSETAAAAASGLRMPALSFDGPTAGGRPLERGGEDGGDRDTKRPRMA